MPGHYYHYFTFGLSSYIDRLLVYIREEIYRLFLAFLKPSSTDTILDIGVSAEDHVSSDHFEKRYPHTARVCALGYEHSPKLVSQFPGIQVVQGDARALPFAANSFDFVYSHAVIEHVGSFSQQLMFLEEALRVARKGVLLATPNRWHPIETHTGLPLLHHLPAAVYRPIYRLLGKDMYATEAALNLLSKRKLSQLVKLSTGAAYSHRICGVRWLGIPSNLVLVISKSAATKGEQRRA